MGTLSQTMARGWSYLGHLNRNLYMFIDNWYFCEQVFWKLCQNSCLSFFLATSTHESTPCQRISFSEYFFTFFDFFLKTVKMVAVTIHCKGSNYPKLSMVLWYNHYWCILKWFFLKKLEQTITHHLIETDKILNISRLSTFLWYNHYRRTLKWFFFLN